MTIITWHHLRHQEEDQTLPQDQIPKQMKIKENTQDENFSYYSTYIYKYKYDTSK